MHPSSACMLVPRPIPSFSVLHTCSVEKLGEPGDEAMLRYVYTLGYVSHTKGLRAAGVGVLLVEGVNADTLLYIKAMWHIIAELIAEHMLWLAIESRLFKSCSSHPTDSTRKAGACFEVCKLIFSIIQRNDIKFRDEWILANP